MKFSISSHSQCRSHILWRSTFLKQMNQESEISPTNTKKLPRMNHLNFRCMAERAKKYFMLYGMEVGEVLSRYLSSSQEIDINSLNIHTPINIKKMTRQWFFYCSAVWQQNSALSLHSNVLSLQCWDTKVNEDKRIDGIRKLWAYFMLNMTIKWSNDIKSQLSVSAN